MTAAAARVPADDVARITEGVFFTTPDALPRGRHTLPRELVLAVQRERLLIAVTELLASHGYRGFSAPGLVRRAGVSLAAFYDCFENLEACVFAGYDRFIEVVVRRLSTVEFKMGSIEEIVETMLGGYLGALQSDLVVARAYQVEIDALGPSARERRRTSLHGVAGVISHEISRVGSRTELPETAWIGIVYAARQLAADALDIEREPDLLGLGRDLQVWIAGLIRGGSDAAH